MKQFLTLVLFVFSSVSFAQTKNVDYMLYQENGTQVRFQDILYNGKAKVFVFWSGYCVPCKYEMRGLTNLSANWYNDYNAEVYFVSLNDYGKERYKGFKFMEDFNHEGQYKLFDPQRKLFDFFNGKTFPTTVLFDKDNNLIHKWSGYDDGLERSLEMYFQKLHSEERILIQPM